MAKRKNKKTINCKQKIQRHGISNAVLGPEESVIAL